MLKHLRRAAALALFSTTPLAAQGSPAALVVQIQGDVQVRHSGASPVPLTLGEQLQAGDEVVPAAGGRAILITPTGATLRVTDATTVAAPAGGGGGDMFDRAIATLAQAATTDARSSIGRQGMVRPIRPIAGEPTLVAPRNGLTVTDERPTFNWRAVEGASGYRLQLRRVDDGSRPKRWDVGTATEWTLPEDEAPLAHGGRYAWTIAPLGGRPTQEQQFAVIGDDATAELEATIEEIAQIGVDPFGDGLFLTAIVYRDLDLYYEAYEALRGLEEAGEMTADLYLLKGEVLNQLGHAERAKEAFDTADEMMR